MQKSKYILMIIGLPGSGKTTLINKMTGILNDFIDAVVVDDINSLDQLPEDFKNVLILSSPLFCYKETREKATSELMRRYPDALIKYEFFENAPDKCWTNVMNRNDGRLISYDSIKHLSKSYHLPAGVIGGSVYVRNQD